MKVTTAVNGNQLEIYRERPATKQEKRQDKEAKVMAENILIEFGEGTPKMSVNRTLCA